MQRASHYPTILRSYRKSRCLVHAMKLKIESTRMFHIDRLRSTLLLGPQFFVWLLLVHWSNIICWSKESLPIAQKSTLHGVNEILTCSLYRACWAHEQGLLQVAGGRVAWQLHLMLRLSKWCFLHLHCAYTYSRWGTIGTGTNNCKRVKLSP